MADVKNWKAEEIADALGPSLSTVYAILKMFDETGDGALQNLSVLSLKLVFLSN